MNDEQQQQETTVDAHARENWVPSDDKITLDSFDEEPFSFIGIYFIIQGYDNPCEEDGHEFPFPYDVGGKILAHGDGFYLYRAYDIYGKEWSTEEIGLQVLPSQYFIDYANLYTDDPAKLFFYKNRKDFDAACKERIIKQCEEIYLLKQMKQQKQEQSSAAPKS